MAGKEVQERIFRKLVAQFGGELVKSEWSVRHESRDIFGTGDAYAPRIDVAVGPFNTTFENRRRDAGAICGYDHPLVTKLFEVVEKQNGDVYKNRNPRCLIAIEVEHSTSSKHILGGITNASMLGLLGVVVGSKECTAKVRRIHDYARKLKRVEKAPSSMFGNVACFSEAEFFNLLRKSAK